MINLETKREAIFLDIEDIEFSIREPNLEEYKVGFFEKSLRNLKLIDPSIKEALEEKLIRCKAIETNLYQIIQFTEKEINLYEKESTLEKLDLLAKLGDRLKSFKKISNEIIEEEIGLKERIFFENNKISNIGNLFWLIVKHSIIIIANFFEEIFIDSFFFGLNYSKYFL